MKSYPVTLTLALILGFFGAHRFYAGKVGTGILFLLTVGFFGIGWIIDILTVAFGNFTDKSGQFIRPNKNRSKENMSEFESAAEPNETPAQKKVPTWVWIVAGVLVFGLILQSCGGDSAPPVAEPEQENLETVPQAEPQPSEPEVEVEPEPEVEVEPEVELSADDIREVVMPLVFDSNRDGVIDILNDMTIVESVDLYTYDAELGLVNIDISPAFDFDSGVRDDAWEIFRLMSAFYASDGNWVTERPSFGPNLRVQISTATYQCDEGSMRDLADAMLSRALWESNCRVR